MVEEYRQRIVIPGAGEVTQTALSDYPIITYKQFRTLEFSPKKHPSGLLVLDVPVRSLLTTSRVLEGVETQRIEDHIKDGKCITPIQAVFGHFPEIRLGPSLVVTDGARTAGYAVVNNIGKVTVLLQPGVYQPSKTGEVRSIREIAIPHKALLRIPPEAEVCIVGIHPIKDGGFALRFHGKKPFKADVVSLETSDGKVSQVNFVDQGGNVISARVVGESAKKLPLEIINKLSIDSKG